MNLYITCIRHGKREAVFAVYAADEADARKKILGRNTGWEVERITLKKDAGVFRIYDSAWYEWGEEAVPTEVVASTQQAWLEDELMEVMRIVSKGMTTETQEDEIIYAMMVTAIRRLMEADTDKYEAVLERYQKRHQPQSYGA